MNPGSYRRQVQKRGRNLAGERAGIRVTVKSKLDFGFAYFLVEKIGFAVNDCNTLLSISAVNRKSLEFSLSVRGISISGYMMTSLKMASWTSVGKSAIASLFRPYSFSPFFLSHETKRDC